MKSALLSKVALCVCPPAMLATTVVTVPPVRQAVHRATRPHHPVRHRPHAKRVAPRQVAAIAPCSPVAAAIVAPLLTFAELAPEEFDVVPATLNDAGGGPGGIAGLPGAGFGPGAVGTAPPVLPALVSPIPEPSTWMMLIAGLGIVGVSLRSRPRRRRYRIVPDMSGTVLVPVPVGRGGRLAAITSAAVAGIGMAWTNTRPVLASSKTAALGGKAIKSAALTKLAMCVCPPAAMIAGTAALPPVRQAVYAATAPKLAHAQVAKSALPAAVTASTVPCPPAEAAIIQAQAATDAASPAIDTRAVPQLAPATVAPVPAIGAVTPLPASTARASATEQPRT